MMDNNKYQKKDELIIGNIKLSRIFEALLH